MAKPKKSPTKPKAPARTATKRAKLVKKPVQATFVRVQEVVSAFTNADPDRIQLRSRFADDLGIDDDLRVTEFVMHLEEELGIVIDEEMASSILMQRAGAISTVGDLVAYIERS